MFLKKLYWSLFLARQIMGQKRYPFKPLDRILRDQSHNISRMVHYAYNHVPYYRETMKRLGLEPSDFKNAADLEKLPLLERDAIQADPERFLSDEWDRKELFPSRTAGSTAKPLEILCDTGALFESAALGERGQSIVKSLLQKRFNYREISLEPARSTTRKVRKLWREKAFIPKRLQAERRLLSLIDPPEKNLALINDFKPDLIYSYGSYLALLFSHIEKENAPFHRPSAIVYSSDGLPESARRLITEKYQIPVFSWYQANEAIKMGFECEQHKGMHINIDRYPARIVDESGNNLPPGEEGEVVISNLVRRSMVFLNYRIGDLAAWIPHPCPCGRNLPLLSFIPGRRDDLITLPDGRTLHPQSIRYIVTGEQKIWQYQVVQHTPYRFQILVVPMKGADREGMEKRIRDYVEETFGRDVTVEFDFVDSIKRTPGGKHRSVKNLCPSKEMTS